MIAIKPHTEPIITPRLLPPDFSVSLGEGEAEADGEEVVDETAEVRDGAAVELAMEEIDVGAAEDTMEEDGLGEGIILVGDGIGEGATELDGSTEELGIIDADADSDATGGVVVLGQLLSSSQKKPALIS